MPLPGPPFHSNSRPLWGNPYTEQFHRRLSFFCSSVQHTTIRNIIHHWLNSHFRMGTTETRLRCNNITPSKSQQMRTGCCSYSHNSTSQLQPRPLLMMQEIPIGTELKWAVLSFLVSLVYRYHWSYGHEIRSPSKLEGRGGTSGRKQHHQIRCGTVCAAQHRTRQP